MATMALPHPAFVTSVRKPDPPEFRQWLWQPISHWVDIALGNEYGLVDQA